MPRKPQTYPHPKTQTAANNDGIPPKPEGYDDIPLVWFDNTWRAMLAVVPLGQGYNRSYRYVNGFIDDPHPLNMERILKELAPFAGEIQTLSPERARALVDAGLTFESLPEKYPSDAPARLGIGNAMDPRGSW